MNEAPQVQILDQTPSTEAVAAANRTVKVTDSRNREISLKKPGVLAQYRLVDLVGPDTAKNDVYMAMIMPVLFVTAIDADAITFPKSRLNLDALIEELGEEGLAAIADAIAAEWGGKKADPEADKGILKN
ncbi:MAG: hypothetical protein JO142_02245 [Burkholderiales bacterium]|nr:hypothetical protein [Burkholderiales bacterium]